MKRRLICLLLVLSMMLSMLPASAFAAQPNEDILRNPFLDVKKWHWFFDAVQYCRVNGIISGMSAELFDPDRATTRGMFVTILGRMAGVDPADYAGIREFDDVPINAYYAPYVAWASKYGIAYGTGDGRFLPEQAVTRQQMAAFFARYFEVFGVAVNSGKTNNTVPGDLDKIADWAVKPVMLLWQQGLLVGDGTNLHPNNNATRAHIAQLCMTVDKAVSVWYSEPGVPSDRVRIDPETGLPIDPEAPVPSDPTDPSDDPTDPSEDPTDPSEDPTDPSEDPTDPTEEQPGNTWSVRFYDGNRLIDTLYAEKGEPLGEEPSLQKSSKARATLLGYYLDEAFTQPFYAHEPVTKDLKVYAAYEEMPSQEVLNFTSFAKLDQKPDLSYEIRRVSGQIPAEEAAVLTTVDGSAPVELKFVKNSGDTYTVSAVDGFAEGHSYQLELAEGWVFEGKPDTIRVASFSIFKEEVQNLQMNDEIVYIPDTDELNYTAGTETYDMLTNALLVAEGGSFSWAGAGDLKQGDILCIYAGKHPQERNMNADLLDPVVYVQVESVSGEQIRYLPLGEEAQKNLYDIPDNFPILVPALPEEDDGTVNLADLDVELYKVMMGDEYDLDAALERINVGDFVSLYVDSEQITSEADLFYGRVTAFDAETDTITYTRTDRRTILESMDLYSNIQLDGTDLVTEERLEELETMVEKQVRASGFAEDAAYMLADIVTKTDGFKNNLSVQRYLLTDENGEPLTDEQVRQMNLGGSFALSDDITLKVELVNKGDKLHFEGGTQLNIAVDASFEVEVEEGKISIDLSAKFTQEVDIDPEVQGELVYKEILFIPIPIGVRVGANIDLLNYTAFSLNADIYTVEEDDENAWNTFKKLMKDPIGEMDIPEIPDVEDMKFFGEVMDLIEEKLDFAKKAMDAGKDYKIYHDEVDLIWKAVEKSGIITREEAEAYCETFDKTRVTTELSDMMENTKQEGLQADYYESIEALMDRYCEMLEKETTWVTLFDKELFAFEVCVLGIAIGVQANFAVRADLSLSIGTNLQYETGKRFSFWFKVGLFKPTAGSDTMDLIDERFAFQFYVMGRLGLRAGIRAKFYVGLGSGKFASIGIAAEVGPYIKIYGFFVYEYTKYRAANTDNWISNERMAGAMYFEFGLYLIVSLEANLLGDTFEFSYDFVDKEFPLLSAGTKDYYYKFQYEPEPDEHIVIRDEDEDSETGITMVLSDHVKEMNCIDLTNGDKSIRLLDYDQYNFRLTNPCFSYDPATAVVSVEVPNGVRYMECDLVITYRYGKMAFSTYDMSVAVPLVWTNLTEEELNEYYTASVRVGNVEDGFRTVWSKKVRKNQPFDLPAEEELRKLIGWSDYIYIAGSGYSEQNLKNLMIVDHASYDYDLDYRTYTLTVDGVHNADGTVSSRSFTARYAEQFSLDELYSSGVVDYTNGVFTKFKDLTVGQEIDVTAKVETRLADALSNGLSVRANYVDNSVRATFVFSGIDHVPIEVKLRKGDIPNLDAVMMAAAEAGLDVKDIYPAVGVLTASTTYQVVCGKLIGPEVTISFVTNGGSALSGLTKVAGSYIPNLPVAEREGYNFLGWYADEALTKAFTDTKMPAQDISLYAKWEAKEYQLTLHVNGGNELEEELKTKKLTFDQPYGELPKPNWEGYRFAGWFTASEGGEAVTAETVLKTAADLTVYAHWEELAKIDPSVFDFGDEEIYTYEMGITRDVEYTFTAGADQTFTEDDFTFKFMRQGKDFYVDGLPIGAGLYNVTVSRPSDDAYAKFEHTYTAVLRINKAIRDLPTPDITVTDSGMTFLDAIVPEGSIYDLHEEAKLVYSAEKTDGTDIILGFGGVGVASTSLESAHIVGLEPGTDYAILISVVDDPNYEDVTAASYSTGARTDNAPEDTWRRAKYWKEPEYNNLGGAGYMITCPEELAWIAYNYPSCRSHSFTLMADIDMSAHQWVPISGPGFDDFIGNVNGNGHTISGLYAIGEGSTGFFYSLREYCSISNLRIVDSYFASGSGYAGAITGIMNGRISNCVVEATVKGVLIDYEKSGVGGIVGYATRVFIDNCAFFGRVSGGNNVGGIIGYLPGGANNNYENGQIVPKNSSVEGCINYGTVQATGYNVGGIVGYNYVSPVSLCVNFGSVTGTSQVGGIVGVNSNEYVGSLNCSVGTVVNYGTVSGTGNYVGAIIGRNTENDGNISYAFYQKHGDLKAAGTKNGSTDETTNLFRITAFDKPDRILLNALNERGKQEWVADENGHGYIPESLYSLVYPE